MAPAAVAEPLHAAVIGTGRISEEHLRFLAGHAGARLSGVCDLSPSLSRYAAGRFGPTAAFDNASAMLHEIAPDVVHVLTPPHTHRRLVTECLEAGAHVIVEKPVAPTNREFRELWSLAASRGLRLIEDHNYRFNRPVHRIEQLVRGGELGEVREVDVRLALNVRGQGGRYADQNVPHPSHHLPAGIIHEFLTHLCYLALRFLPNFDRVAAAWSNHGGGPFRYDDLDALVIAGPIHARLRFTCCALPESFDLTVRGTRGWAETDLFHPYVRVVRSRPRLGPAGPLISQLAGGMELTKAGLLGFRNKLLQRTAYEGMHTFLSQTYTALRKRAEPPVGYEDMDRASRLVDSLLGEGNRI